MHEDRRTEVGRPAIVIYEPQPSGHYDSLKRPRRVNERGLAYLDGTGSAWLRPGVEGFDPLIHCGHSFVLSRMYNAYATILLRPSSHRKHAKNKAHRRGQMLHSSVIASRYAYLSRSYQRPRDSGGYLGDHSARPLKSPAQLCRERARDVRGGVLRVRAVSHVEH